MARTEEAGVTDVGSIPVLGHQEGQDLAAAEYSRTLDLWKTLGPADWAAATGCPPWDIRAMAAHVLGMAEAQASMRQFAHDFRSAGRRTSGAMIDAMTATQVRDRAGLSPSQIVEQLARVAPKAVRARRRTPAAVRWAVRMRQDPPFDGERWSYGYLIDRIMTRDTWMHRLDVCRAARREMDVTPDHDGRLIADVVADWAQRHGRPFMLELTGAAGGRWRGGEGGERIEMDALEFCLTLSGRGSGAGLLTQEVPF